MTIVTDDLPVLAEDYEADGVIRVRGLFPPDKVAEVRRELDRYIAEVVPTLAPTERVFEADGTSVRNLWQMDRHDAYFRGLAAADALRTLLTELLHGEPVLIGVETFNKPAKVGSNVPAHQDNAYFCLTPPDVLTVWVAMDAATRANGPVNYLKGTHKLGMLPHAPSGVAGNSMGLDGPLPDGERFVGLLEPGDALIHHCQTIHESEPNRSDAPRLGLLMVFRGAHAQTDPTLKAAYTQAQARK